MTAIVGVLNKHAVAIAADSAVTMGNTHKVINSANKIFTLSKYNPVAVMTYNNAAFMGVPWDIIIKEYRRQLGEKSLSSVEEYMTNFIDFLHIRHFFSDEKTQHNAIISTLDTIYNLCHDEILQEKGVPVESQTCEQIEEKLNQYLEKLKIEPKCIEFEKYTFEEFEIYAKTDISNYVKNNNIKDETLLAKVTYYYLSAKYIQPFYTGLVFVGYGEEEIYPSLYPIKISLGINNRLKYFIETNRIAKISEHGSSAIIAPFAQTDVIQTIIRGINPSFQNIIYKIVDKSIRFYSKAITDILDKNADTLELSSAIKGLNKDLVINNTISDIKQEMFNLYSKPLIDTVVLLDKEDMANMAESFISLTSLVRRMQPGEETVGGPVDVAVISKGDGFVWINRKHYFKPELNASFFSNYFK